MIAVFHLGLGQGGFAVAAPVHRFEAFINVAFAGHSPEDLNLYGFKNRVQGHVGVLPVASDPQALELAALDVQIFQGILFAVVSELHHIGAVTVQAQGLDGLLFDGQPVGIPPRHIRRIITGHGFIFDDYVLQYLIQGVADVNVPVGIRRPVMQYKSGPAGVFVLHLFINPGLFPVIQDFGLPGG